MVSQKLVYLDQNAWIYLLRQKEGIINDSDIANSLDCIVKASKSDDVMFPLSLVHLIETSSKLDSEKRDKLSEFMIEISKGYAIIPYVRIINYEIREAVYKKAGLPPNDLKRIVIGKGIPAIFGSKIELVKSNENAVDLPENLKQKMIETAESPETLLWSLKNKAVIDNFREGRKIEYDILSKLEEVRSQNKQIVDNDLRRRVEAFYFFKGTIIPEMVKVMLRVGIKKELILPLDSTREDVENLFKSIPTAYTTFALTHRRDMLGQRRIDKNDLNDISALSIAIPYCDIVVTENMWASIANQEKLNEIYNTTVLSSVKDLAKHLTLT